MKRKTKRRNLSQTDLFTIFGLNRPASIRYKGLKGVFWYVTSLYVRLRDFKQWGRCIGCDRRVADWRELQAGHFISAARCGFDLLFDLKNINGECPGCNAYDKQKLGYERSLDARYGAGTAQALKDRYFASKKVGGARKEYTKLEYERAIRGRLGEIELLGVAQDL